MSVCVCDGVMIFLIYDDWVVGVKAKFGKKATINKILNFEEAYLKENTFNFTFPPSKALITHLSTVKFV